VGSIPASRTNVESLQSQDCRLFHWSRRFAFTEEIWHEQGFH